MEQENEDAESQPLIDAENTQASIIEALLAEIANTRRCERQATSTATGPRLCLRGWKDVLLEHAIQPT